LSGKPWFTFEDGHLLKGLSVDYANRLFDWFYRGEKPPYHEIGATLSIEALQEATQQYNASATKIKQALLDSLTPQALLSAVNQQQPANTLSYSIS
jgi:hypothetical protein